MIVYPDDEIYRVDEVFLGPERFRFPWRWTYRQYGVALVTFLALQGIERQLGIPFGLWPAAFSLLVTIAVARWVHEGVNWDRGLKTLFTEAQLELSGPRRQRQPVRTVLTAPRSRAQRKHRDRKLRETYGDDTPSTRTDDDKIPSWWAQFRIRTDKNTNNSSQNNGHSVNGYSGTRSTNTDQGGEAMNTVGGQRQ